MSITVGSKVKVTNGCRALGITKGSTAKVETVVELGPDYSYSVKVGLRFLNSYKAGTMICLVTRHINRLSDPWTNLNNGDPYKKITIQEVR
jgi:hypothetical protein